MSFLTDEQFVGILTLDTNVLTEVRNRPELVAPDNHVAIPLVDYGPETYESFSGDGTRHPDWVGNWETAQTYAAEGRLLIALAPDGSKTIDDVQAIVNRELILWADCYHGVDITLPEGVELRSVILAPKD